MVSNGKGLIHKLKDLLNLYISASAIHKKKQATGYKNACLNKKSFENGK
jgi:hypothetical protein